MDQKGNRELEKAMKGNVQAGKWEQSKHLEEAVGDE